MTENLFQYNLSIRKGDASAFKKVFEALFTPLLHYAMHFNDDEMLAEEMVQEAFLLLWEKRRKINAEFNTKAYIFKIVHNQVLNHIRHEKVIQTYIQQDKKEEAVESTADPLLADAIYNAMEELSPRVKLIFELSKIKGFKNKEIASELSISLKTVEVQLRNAKLKLQKLLKPYYKNL